MGIYKIGTIIKQLRTQKAFTQKQLAEGICSTEYISKIENGCKSPSPEMTSKLLHRLGVNPDMFFTNLSTADNDLYNEHCFEIEQLLSASKYEEAEKYIHMLSQNFSFYSAGEPLQYLMGKRAHILANLNKEFEKSYELAYESILITKADFTPERITEYDFYSVNELWAMLYMASAFYWKQKHFSIDDDTTPDITPAITLISTVLSHLERGYHHPSLIGTLYASAMFYLTRFLYSADRAAEALPIAEKGMKFITGHYNQIIELLGKIIMNQAACAYACKQPESKEMYQIAKTLLLLAGNEETLQWYLSLDYDVLFNALK